MHSFARDLLSIEARNRATARRIEGVKPGIQAELERLRRDLVEATGQPFRHFLCPLLLVDEPTPLCKGHIVNRAFSDAPNRWTIQRRDVDNFFGAVAESDFTVLESATTRSRFDHVTDPRMPGRLKPEILLDRRPVEYFVPKGAVPKHFTPLRVETDTAQRWIALKMRPDEVSDSLERDWKLEVSIDLRFPALVSLLKAAFLTKFALLGYRYALSVPGRLIGEQLLGRFFRKMRSAPRSVAAAELHRFFGAFANMVRPVLRLDLPFEGTIVDRQVLLCWSPLGFAWGSIVFVRAAGLHAVLLPVEGRREALVLFERFLEGSTEKLEVREARLCGEGGDQHWEVAPRSVAVPWPRSTET